MELSKSHLEHRSKDRQEVASAINSAGLRLNALNEDIAFESGKNYGGLVLFAKDNDYAYAAVTLHNVTPDTPADLHEFLDSNIKSHYVDLSMSASALGVFVKTKPKTPEFMASLMNPNHMTSIAPIITDDNLDGLAQVSFDSRYTSTLIPEKTMVSLWKKYNSDINDAMQDISRVKRMNQTIGRTFELDLPTTPNAYLIRWDVVGSTRLATGRHKMAFYNYLDDINMLVENITKNQEKSVSGTGDGQNIAIFLPADVKRNKINKISQFGKEKVNPIIQQLLDGQRLISNAYPEFKGNIKLAVDLTHIETLNQNGVISYNSPSYWKTATILKDPKSADVNYTQSAKETLLMDGAERLDASQKN